MRVYPVNSNKGVIPPYQPPKDKKQRKEQRLTEEEKALSSVGLRPPYNPQKAKTKNKRQGLKKMKN